MANPSEIYLTTSNVNSATFGKLFARNVDGQIMAQPLYLQNVVFSNQTANVVYVATMQNTVYAFDADHPSAQTPIWSVNLGAADVIAGWDGGLGILSTPVIVRSLSALYVVATTRESGLRVYRLHVLDLLNGAEKFGGPMVVGGQVSGTAPDGLNGVVTFYAGQHIQRTGLAVTGNSVYFAFSADRDRGNYHGWVFGYNIATLSQTAIFNDTPNGLYSGIWQSGRAPAVDAGGSLYYETGNGAFDGSANFGESLLKLTPNGAGALTLSDWFTPDIWNTMNTYDYDYGSSGPGLIPGANLVYGGGKTGVIYVTGTNSLGHVQSGNPQISQSLLATTGCAVPLAFQSCSQIEGQAFWYSASTPNLFVWGVHDRLKAFPFSNGQFAASPSSSGSQSAYYPGGMLAVSSYLGVQGTGIVWAATDDTPDNGFYFGPGFNGAGTLHAYDATNLTHELWNSAQIPGRDGLGEFASFTPPVVANGKVYMASFSNQLVVYGLLNGTVIGDVNGDSLVTCADLAIVKTSFGKTSSQAGYDLRADVNQDGVVNIKDLALVSQHLPGGTVCQ